MLKPKTWTLQTWHAHAPPDGQLREKYWGTGGLAKQENIELITLANLGMTVKTIVEFTGLSTHQVRYRLKRFGIKVTDFRRGHGPIAALVFQNLADRVTKESIQLVRERHTDTYHG